MLGERALELFRCRQAGPLHKLAVAVAGSLRLLVSLSLFFPLAATVLSPLYQIGGLTSIMVYVITFIFFSLRGTGNTQCVSYGSLGE